MNAALLKTGAAAAVVGAVAAGVANALRPLPLDMDTEEVLREVATTNQWEFIQLFSLFAAILLSAGLAIAACSMIRESGSWQAFLGLILLVIGAPLAVAASAVDGVARGPLARAWLEAPPGQREHAYRIVEAADSIWYGLFLGWIVLLVGLAPFAVGVAQLGSRLYPAWTGAVGSAAGFGATVLGIVFWLRGGFDAGYIMLSMLVTAFILWSFTTGLVMWRRSSEYVPAAPAPG